MHPVNTSPVPPDRTCNSPDRNRSSPKRVTPTGMRCEGGLRSNGLAALSRLRLDERPTLDTKDTKDTHPKRRISSESDAFGPVTHTANDVARAVFPSGCGATFSMVRPRLLGDNEILCPLKSLREAIRAFNYNSFVVLIKCDLSSISTKDLSDILISIIKWGNIEALIDFLRGRINLQDVVQCAGEAMVALINDESKLGNSVANQSILDILVKIQSVGLHLNDPQLARLLYEAAGLHKGNLARIAVNGYIDFNHPVVYQMAVYAAETGNRYFFDELLGTTQNNFIGAVESNFVHNQPLHLECLWVATGVPRTPDETGKTLEQPAVVKYLLTARVFRFPNVMLGRILVNASRYNCLSYISQLSRIPELVQALGPVYDVALLSAVHAGNGEVVSLLTERKIFHKDVLNRAIIEAERNGQSAIRNSLLIVANRFDEVDPSGLVIGFKTAIFSYKLSTAHNIVRSPRFASISMDDLTSSVVAVLAAKFRDLGCVGPRSSDVEIATYMYGQQCKARFERDRESILAELLEHPQLPYAGLIRFREIVLEAIYGASLEPLKMLSECSLWTDITPQMGGELLYETVEKKRLPQFRFLVKDQLLKDMIKECYEHAADIARRNGRHDLHFIFLNKLNPNKVPADIRGRALVDAACYDLPMTLRTLLCIGLDDIPVDDLAKACCHAVQRSDEGFKLLIAHVGKLQSRHLTDILLAAMERRHLAAIKSLCKLEFKRPDGTLQKFTNAISDADFQRVVEAMDVFKYAVENEDCQAIYKCLCHYFKKRLE